MTYSVSGSKPTFWAMVAVCFTSLVAVLFLAGSGNAQSEQFDSASVSVEASELDWQQSFSKIQRVVGRVEANQRANLGFELSGMV